MKKAIKVIIVILIILFIVLLFSIYYFLKINNNNNTQNNVAENNLTSNESGDTNILVDRNTSTNPMPYIEEDVDNWGEDDEPKPQSELKLAKVDDEYTYLLINQCVETFYLSSENAINLIDKEAIGTLGINQNNIADFYGNIERPQFRIDEIYKEEVNLSKDIYLVYYRVQIGENEIESQQMIVVVEKKNVAFSVYPYEYLKQNNLLNLKEDDNISLKNTEDIERNNYNIYRTDDLIANDEENTEGSKSSMRE